MTTPPPAGRTHTVHGFAARERDAPVTPWEFPRREPRPDDVVLDVLFCGSATATHTIRPWEQEFPLVPGHEMVGRVTEVGPDVTGFQPGDLVAVSSIVDSCGECDPCQRGDEISCEDGATTSYDGIDRIDGSRIRGGYVESITVRGRFVFPVPDGLDPAGAAPLLCAGITI